ncbi:transcobalamin-2 isoform X2 [Heterodontus francisci]
MQPRVLLLISCVQVLFLSVKLEANPEETIVSLNKRLLRFTGPGFPANPSIYIALRLSTEHNLHDERRYLHRLKADLRDKLSSSPGLQTNSKPSTSLIALYLLALRASCQDHFSQHSAVRYLKEKLNAEKKHLNYHDVPLTNYYQYSLGVLALCVYNVRLNHGVLSGLMLHDHHHHCFDTEAMLVLALRCVHESKVPSSDTWMYSNNTRTKAETAMNKLIQKIQKRQTEKGKIGNIYSTSVALQVLLAVGDRERWSKGKKRLLIEAQEGAFRSPMALSQLLPVLYQKTYLDIRQMDCNNENDGLKQMRSEPGITESNQQVGFVHLTVKNESAVIYKAKVPLRDQMSLLGVLKEARNNDTNFNFETKQTLWGPFLTSVDQLRGQDIMRTYWRLMTGENTPLKQGIQDYLPHPGEDILLQLSTF